MRMIDPITDRSWEDLRARAGGGTIFEHPGWLQLLRQQYGYDISAWCLTDDSSRLVAGLPVARVSSRLTGTRLVALPFSDTCSPLVDAGARASLAQLAEAVAEQRSAMQLGLEVRAELPGAPGGQLGKTYVRHLLPLEADVDAVCRRFVKSQVRRGIAKARREGVTVDRRTDEESLHRFYRLHLQTRQHQGVPTQPKRFILRFARLFEAGLGFVLIARHRDRDAAAAVFLSCGETLTYKYGASDRRLLHVRPNNLLFMEAIDWGCRNGQRTLDFGRTDLANGGLRAFKQGWGAEEVPLRYTHFGVQPAGDASSLTERALGATIRRAPTGVGRLIGEALYRHVG